MILKYAEIIKRPSTHLEAVDAEVFCAQNGKSLAIAVDSPGNLEVKVSVGYWNAVLDAPVDLPEVDPEDPKLWVLVSCNANFDPHAEVRNHWVPAFYKGQVSDDDFLQLTVEKQRILLAEYRQKRDELIELEGIVESMKLDAGDDDPDSENLEIEQAKTMVVDCQMEMIKSFRLTNSF
jgi:hypothetical protein